MQLNARRIQAADFPNLVPVLTDRSLFDGALGARLPELWRVILEGSGNGGLVENPERAPGDQILVFGFSIFVQPAFAVSLRAGQCPNAGLQILRGWVDGRSPMLTPAEIRDANSHAGLHLFVGFNGMQDWVHVGSDDHIRMTINLSQCFREHHLGFRFNEILLEWNLEAVRPYIEGSGLWPLHWKRANASGAGRQANVYGISRKEAVANPGATLSEFFTTYAPPRILLTPREQQVIVEALDGRTDEQLADKLGLSVSSIKKRWLKIYDQAMTSEAVPIADERECNGYAAARGAEKRRRLLAYVRAHPEELRPVNPKLLQPATGADALAIRRTTGR